MYYSANALVISSFVAINIGQHKNVFKIVERN